MTELGATSRFQAGVLIGRQAADSGTDDVLGGVPAGEEIAVHK
jgi:hypothetical protein